MLTKRTNILFGENQWERLVGLAESRNTSIGELVRKAVADKYLAAFQDQEVQRAYRDILSLRKRRKGVIDYKALIGYGRKY